MRALVLGLMLLVSQDKKSAREAKGRLKPPCAAGAICFDGEINQGQEFQRAINRQLEFVLTPDPEMGWRIKIASARRTCDDLASVVTTPIRGHNDLDITGDYGLLAEGEVEMSPREFQFVENCDDSEKESERLEIILWPNSYPQKVVDDALNNFGTLATGKGRFWITGSRISHKEDTPENPIGKIEWMKFSVELAVNKPRSGQR